eukprot:scaffold117943_cov33-Attheya_sp.AAC.1
MKYKGLYLVPHLEQSAVPHGISDQSSKKVLVRTLITLRKAAFVANTELKENCVEEAKTICSVTSTPEDRDIEVETAYHKFPNNVRTIEAFKNKSYPTIDRCNIATVIFGYINAHDHSPPFGMKVRLARRHGDDRLSSLTGTYSHVHFCGLFFYYPGSYRRFYAQDAEPESKKTVEGRTKTSRQNQSKTAR